MKSNTYKLKNFVKNGVSLTPIEFKEHIPFEVKRIYFMDVKDGSETSQHCHLIEKEVFVQVKGKSKIIIDDGEGKKEIELNAEGDAIFVPNHVWHGFKDCKEGCVILALSSTNYSPSREDYIEDYESYLKIRDEKLGL